MARLLRGLSWTTVAGVGGGYLALQWWNERRRWHDQQHPLASELSAAERKAAVEWRPPSRSQLLARLKDTKDEPYDLVIIGGGATGTGCAVDAASRGLRVALVERDDFSAGTSSKSTKLVHGGVRYLEKAFWGLDLAQFEMVREALHERSILLRIAPHLTDQMPIMIPVYAWWRIPYYWAGAKAYDMFAGVQGLEKSYFMSRSEAIRAFPMLKREALAGAVVYYDGVQNDARTNVALALTALQQGADVTNYTEVIGLVKERPLDGNDVAQIRGVIVKDRRGGETFTIRCRGVINATGPFCDGIRKLDDPDAPPLVQPSIGTHVVFPSYYSPRQLGLIDPASRDGRVIFFLPWEGSTLAGTTDAPSEMTFEPKATAHDIDFIVESVRRYLDPALSVRASDVLSAWSGLRPLVRNPAVHTTQELLRRHAVLVSPSGLISIVGGKWTTYRRMAADTIDAAISLWALQPSRTRHSRTEQIPLIGAHDYQRDLTTVKLVQQFGFDTDVAAHLAHSYGDRAFIVAALGSAPNPKANRLAPGYPYQESEVVYAVRFEYAQTAIDVLARRTRLAHLDCHAALVALPRVIALMGDELGWSPIERHAQTVLAKTYLEACGSSHLSSVQECQAKQQWIETCQKAFLSAHPDPQQARLWARLTPEQSIAGWRRVLQEEGLDDLPPSHIIDRVVGSLDRAGLGSLGFAEFLEGSHLLRSVIEERSMSTSSGSQ